MFLQGLEVRIGIAKAEGSFVFAVILSDVLRRITNSLGGKGALATISKNYIIVERVLRK